MLVRVLAYLLLAGGEGGGRARVGPTRPFRQVVSTQGVARGYLASPPPHYAFLGLPYARAPTLRHRFKAPQPPPSWDGIFEGTHRIKCPQDGSGDENCLVLNVFIPSNGTELPVLVIVHDGQFQNGWGAHRAPARFLTQDLIVVTFNYRLGMLGFLCLGIPEAPGNVGLKDQVAALYWVQRNIAAFGGNPDDVTLYGIGSGAVAVQLLLLSGLTDGLFYKVILESGSGLSPHTFNYEPVTLAFNAAANLGYEGTENLTELVEFLALVTVEKLTNISEMFLPCIENYEYDESLLVWDAMEVLRKGSFQQVPLVMIYSDRDGASMVQNNIDQFIDLPESYHNLLPDNLVFNDAQTRLRMARFIKEIYFDDDSKSTEQDYADYFHDVLYEYPIVKSAVLYAEQSTAPTYVMKFTYNQRDVKDNNEKNAISNYLFSEDNLNEDEDVCARLINVLCNFIKLGDPTPITTSEVPIIWQALQDCEKTLSVWSAPILIFDETIAMDAAGTNQQLAFWDKLYDNFYKSYAPIHNNVE